MTLFKQALLVLTSLLSGLLFSISAFGQTEEESSEVKKKHSIALGVGHTHVKTDIDIIGKEWLNLPSWSLDYNYRISEKWAISCQNEIILGEIEVESEDDNKKTISRTRPFSTMLAVTYFPIERLGVFMASGAEFAKEGNFGMFRIGVEPNLEINERLEVFATVIYDFKIEVYDSYGIAFGLGYKF
jgi:hypothetical protein